MLSEACFALIIHIFDNLPLTLHIIVIYEMSARKHFSRMSALFLFEARATKERVLHLRECAEYVFSHQVRKYFLKRTLCLISRIPCVNRMALVMRLQSVNRIKSDLFSLFQNFHHPNWRNGVL
jgi:hypothetical protein